MTDHPLTDEIIDKMITEDECLRREGDGRALYYEEDFRTAADWQLEQVIEYLEKDLEFVLWSDSFMKKFKKAMRPTTTQEDWKDIQTAIERKDSIPVPITLEELSKLSNITQEDNQ